MKPGEYLKEISKVITEEKIKEYAEVSGDFNPIHLDKEYASHTSYGGIIAHGFMTVAYISEMMANNFNRGWLEGGSLQVRFTAPAKPGDRITARGVVQKVEQEKGGKVEAFCTVWCENQEGSRVLSGAAKATMIPSATL